MGRRTGREQAAEGSADGYGREFLVEIAGRKMGGRKRPSSG